MIHPSKEYNSVIFIRIQNKENDLGRKKKEKILYFSFVLVSKSEITTAIPIHRDMEKDESAKPTGVILAMSLHTRIVTEA